MKIILFIIFLAGCSPISLQDLRFEAEAEIKRLAAELKPIETKEELQKAKPKLKKRFNRIADILVRVKKLPHQESLEPIEASEALFIEMARLYEIPGAREIFESAQNDAVRRLGSSCD